MTVEVQDTFTIKTKRTEHPNAGKYPGRPSMEFGTGLRQFMSDIGMNNLDAFSKGTFVFEEEITAEFFDSIIPAFFIIGFKDKQVPVVSLSKF